MSETQEVWTNGKYYFQFYEGKINKKSNYYRKYESLGENILDIINTYGDETQGGITSTQITNYIGVRASSIRKYLAEMINRVNSEKYFFRKRIGSFRYYRTGQFDPSFAYQDILNSTAEKKTLNQVGLKNSIHIDKLIENGETFPNIINILKKSMGWTTVSELSKILGVENKKGKITIREELRRCLKCSLKFVEKKKIGDETKYRLFYKYRRHTISELKELANRTFPKDTEPVISKHKVQVVNNVLSMKGG